MVQAPQVRGKAADWLSTDYQLYRSGDFQVASQKAAKLPVSVFSLLMSEITGLL